MFHGWIRHKSLMLQSVRELHNSFLRPAAIFTYLLWLPQGCLFLRNRRHSSWCTSPSFILKTFLRCFFFLCLLVWQSSDLFSNKVFLARTAIATCVISKKRRRTEEAMISVTIDQCWPIWGTTDQYWPLLKDMGHHGPILTNMGRLGTMLANAVHHRPILAILDHGDPYWPI